MRWLLAIGLVWASAVAAPAGRAAASTCVVALEFEPYPVSGASAAEVRAAMLERGPRDAAGAPRFAFADWKVVWHWQRDQAGRVRGDTVEVQCRARMVLPHLEADAARSAGLSVEWGGFIARVLRHEQNHLEHVRRLAPRIRTQIIAAERRQGRLSPYQAQKIASRVVGEIRALDRWYDRRTTHGKSEGVWAFGREDVAKGSR